MEGGRERRRFPGKQEDQSVGFSGCRRAVVVGRGGKEVLVEERFRMMKDTPNPSLSISMIDFTFIYSSSPISIFILSYSTLPLLFLLLPFFFPKGHTCLLKLEVRKSWRRN